MRINSIGLITLNCPHLKTEQVTRVLHAKGRYEITLFALPWSDRKSRTPIFDHRPSQFKGSTMVDMAAELGIQYSALSYDSDIKSGLDLYIILSGQLLSDIFVTDNRVINCHAGIIPIVRGLDAFKWSVYECLPLGVTLHEINKDIDSGTIYNIVQTPVYKTDSLEVLAQRHYQNEIDVLCNFDYHMSVQSNKISAYQSKAVRKRMPPNTEKIMINSFGAYMKEYAI